VESTPVSSCSLRVSLKPPKLLRAKYTNTCTQSWYNKNDSYSPVNKLAMTEQWNINKIKGILTRVPREKH